MRHVGTTYLIDTFIASFGVLFTMLISGIIVEKLVTIIKTSQSNKEEKQKSSHNLMGAIIGKCENFIIITFILSNEITALAIIFTAKALVRIEEIKNEPEYYLAGSIINFSLSVLMAYLIKFSQFIVLYCMNNNYHPPQFM